MKEIIAVVSSRQDAANRQDIDRLTALSAPDIAIIGPRGSGSGHQLLRDWMSRAGLELTTQRVFGRGDTVVVAQHGIWRSVDTATIVGEADLASRFRVRDRQVTEFERHDDLATALAVAHLTLADEQRLER
jgi:hypothetical protein